MKVQSDWTLGKLTVTAEGDVSAPVTPNLTVVDKRPNYEAGDILPVNKKEGQTLADAAREQYPGLFPPVVSAKPLGNKVLLWRIPEVEGAVIKPDVAAEKPTRCKVVAVGEQIPMCQMFNQITQRHEPQPILETGDEVLIRNWSGTEVKVEGHDLTVILVEDILLKL